MSDFTFQHPTEGTVSPYTSCTCHDDWLSIGPPPPCPLHPGWTQPVPISVPYTPFPATTVPVFPVIAQPQPLSDADVDRIARRLADILKQDT